MQFINCVGDVDVDEMGYTYQDVPVDGTGVVGGGVDMEKPVLPWRGYFSREVIP